MSEHQTCNCHQCTWLRANQFERAIVQSPEKLEYTFCKQSPPPSERHDHMNYKEFERCGECKPTPERTHPYVWIGDEFPAEVEAKIRNIHMHLCPLDDQCWIMDELRETCRLALRGKETKE